MTRKVKPLIQLEQLEPRIMLSADGLLNAIVPDQDLDMSLDGTQQVVQYAELLETQEQIEEQVISDTSNNDNCRPILTLSIDDDKVNDESGDADLSVDSIGSPQTIEMVLLSNDSDGEIESKVGTTEDDSMPTYINDADLSIEYATSIEIRGPPASDIVDNSTSAALENVALQDENILLDGYTKGLQAQSVEVVSTVEQQALELFSVSPALFVENQGQWLDPSVRYVHDGSFADVAITDSGVAFHITGSEQKEDDQSSLAIELYQNLPLEQADIRSLQFSVSFIGADEIQPIGLERSESLFNYFIGDEANWREGVAGYEIVTYEELYEGIDLLTWGLRSHLKYEFHVAPGADFSQVAVRYEGIGGLSLAEDGSLIVDLGEGWGSLIDDAPYIYQMIDGRQMKVAGRFVLLDEWTYSFEIIGDYDPASELFIDPHLAWSIYLGGSNSDYGYGIAVDASGNIFVTGGTYSADFEGANNAYKGGYYDAFVAKVSSGGLLLWATYLGGSSEDYARGIAVDASGNIFVTGYTHSTDFAGANNAYKGGDGDAFVARPILDDYTAYPWISGSTRTSAREPIAPRCDTCRSC